MLADVSAALFDMVLGGERVKAVAAIMFLATAVTCASALPAVADSPQEACASVAEYAGELGFVIYLGSTGDAEGATDALQAARERYERDLKVFRIVAGPKSREFGLSEKAGIDVWRAAAQVCVSEGKCASSTAKPAAMYSTFLTEFCRQDYEESR